jgi:hypothetical protein
LGAQLAAVILVQTGTPPAETDYTTAFLASAAVALVALVTSTALPRAANARLTAR